MQKLGKIPVNVDAMGVDLLTISSHKIYGPKGVGALYVRKGTKIKPQVTGASMSEDFGQEQRMFQAS